MVNKQFPTRVVITKKIKKTRPPPTNQSVSNIIDLHRCHSYCSLGKDIMAYSYCKLKELLVRIFHEHSLLICIQFMSIEGKVDANEENLVEKPQPEQPVHMDPDLVEGGQEGSWWGRGQGGASGRVNSLLAVCLPVAI